MQVSMTVRIGPSDPSGLVSASRGLGGHQPELRDQRVGSPRAGCPRDLTLARAERLANALIQPQPALKSPDPMSHRTRPPENAIAKKTEEVVATTGADLLKEYLPSTIKTNAGAVSVVLGFIGVMWTVYHTKKFFKYIEEISLELDSVDRGALARLLELHGHKSWFAENLDRGFRQMMEATDPFARKCIVLLVADYLRNQSMPDLDYQRVGHLFAESNEAILRMIDRIGHKACGLTQAGIFAYRRLEVPGARYAVAGHKGAYEVDLLPMDLGSCEEPDIIDATCAVMIRTGFASPWFGDATEVVRVHQWPSKESNGFEIVVQEAVVEYHQNRLLAFAMKYIDPVVQKPPSAEEADEG